MPTSSSEPRPAPGGSPDGAPEAGLRMVRARAQLLLSQPFFGSLALRLELRPDPACAGMWTDGRSLGFNPDALAALSDAEVMGMQAHEVLHLACRHHLRRAGRDPALWNRACDLAVNGLLLDAGFTLPRGMEREARHAGRAAEEIYEILAAELGDTGGAGQGPDQGLRTPSAGSGAAAPRELSGRERSPAVRLLGGTARRLAREARRNRAREAGGAQAPSASPGAAARSGEVRDHPELDGGARASASDAAALERDLDIAVSRAAQQAAGMGRLPGGLARLFAAREPARVDWREELRRFVTRQAVSDYSWSPPNRRFVHLGLRLPSPRNESLPEIVLAVDCSGSVDQPLLDRFCAELSGILEAYDARLTAVFCDCEVRGTRELTRFDLPLRLEAAGGGGTDYRPVFAAVERLGLAPACLIYLTDLECDRFGEEPPYPVLWAGGGAAMPHPPFGERVRID